MTKYKIGTLFGVFIPNVTMMFGVILFIRIGVISSHAGALTMLGVIALSLAIMLITSASVASIATNIEVGAGGTYYLITRSLGIEVGGALGLVTYLSQILSIALTTSGFAYSVAHLIPELSITQIEVITLCGLALISSISAKFALKVQGLIIVILVAAIISIFFGSVDNLGQLETHKTFYPNGKLLFWSTFSLFYPAMTGIEAGMALSGTLKNPGRSLMIGNMTSLIFVAIVYFVISFYGLNFIPLDHLKTDPFVLVKYSHYGFMITIGICVATLSSSLGALVGAPIMLQSMANDGIVPSIFRKTHGKHQEPLLALLFTTLFSLILTIYTTIDHIIPMLTMICLINYGLLNLISALASWMNSPSWRPQFKIHHSISILGFILIIISMFMVNAGWSFISLLVVFSLYIFLKQADLGVSFKDFRSSIIFFLSRLALYRLAESDNQALTWHPKILALITAPSKHPKTIWLANSLTRQSGILTFASVVPENWTVPERLDLTRDTLETYFRKKNIACLIEVNSAPSTQEGYVNLIQAYGIGPIQPNTVIVPIDNDNPLGHNTVEIIATCRSYRKNIVIINDDSEINEKTFEKRLKHIQKNIYVHWDPENRKSFYLLLSLITILHDCPKWSQSKVFLVSLKSKEQNTESIRSFLDEFIHKGRIKMEILVYTSDQYDNAKSHPPHIVTTTLREFAIEEDNDHYLEYLRAHIQKYNKGVGLFVCNYDSIEHQEIFHYNE